MRVQKILVPYDFSPCSDEALDHAAGWARSLGARLTLLNVLPVSSRERSNHTREVLVELVGGDLAQVAWTRLAGIVADTMVLEGERAETILRVAAEGFDLVHMGTHGRSGIQGLYFGSIAEQVVRRAPCPVITHSPKEDAAPTGLPERILCAVKLGKGSSRTLELAMDLAAQTEAFLTVLHVVEWYKDALPTAFVDPGEVDDYLTTGAQRELESFVPKQAAASGRLATRVRVGKGYEQILQAATEEGSQLIILGKHTAMGAGDQLFGSTAQRVIREAPCPVLTLNAKARTAEHAEVEAQEPVLASA